MLFERFPRLFGYGPGFRVRDQHISRFGGEFGVQAQHFDREGNLINDTLSRPVATAEKLQVVDRVMLPVAVDVVDSFLGEKRAPEMLFHNPAMFKHLPFFAAGNVGGDGDPNVAVAFDMPSDVARLKTISGAHHLRSNLAFVAAKTLLRVIFDATRRAVLSSRECLLAMFTGEKLCSGIVRFATRVCACARAVHWQFAEFLLVGAHIRWLHREAGTACFALERGRFYTCGLATINRLMSMPARVGAVLLFQFALAMDDKRRIAGDAFFGNWLKRLGHWFSPCCDERRIPCLAVLGK
jgi:hypothetical protein